MGQDEREVVMVRVPARIDFAGGWSDVHYFSEREGGAVVSAAISPCVEGRAWWDERQLHLEYTLDLPPGSHLGTSSSIDVAWLTLTNGLMKRQQAPAELAESAYHLEKLLGIAGGKQDHYVAAFGGFLMLRFGREEDPAQVERLDVASSTVSALQERCVLAYAGLPPRAGSEHERVWERYRQGDSGIASSLRMIRDSTAEARSALLSGDLDALAGIMTLNRETVRRLHTGLITERMDELFRAGEEAGAIGAKGCGAGGGGCLLFLCAGGRRAEVEDALRARGARIIPFDFAGPL